jgi:hypothetical protein
MRPSQLGTPARRPPELISKKKTNPAEELADETPRSVLQAGRPGTRAIGRNANCGNRASVPLRLSYFGQGDNGIGVQGFLATTRLAAKAGEQSCSVAPWQRDLSSDKSA